MRMYTVYPSGEAVVYGRHRVLCGRFYWITEPGCAPLEVSDVDAAIEAMDDWYKRIGLFMPDEQVCRMYEDMVVR